MSNYQELFSILHQLSYIFPKQRERRIGHHNVGLFQQLNTFLAAKVTITFKWFYPYFLSVGDTVAVFVAFIHEKHSLFAFVLAEEIHVLILVASGYKLLQSKKLEVVCKVSEEVAYAWVVAVAQHRLAAKMFTIMA